MRSHIQQCGLNSTLYKLPSPTLTLLRKRKASEDKDMFDPVKKAAIDPEEKVDKEKKLPEKQDTYDLQIGTREDECKDKENEEEEEKERAGGLGENHRRVAEEAQRLSAKKVAPSHRWGTRKNVR